MPSVTVYGSRCAVCRCANPFVPDADLGGYICTRCVPFVKVAEQLLRKKGFIRVLDACRTPHTDPELRPLTS